MPKAKPLKFGPCFAVSSVFAAMVPLAQLPAVADDTAPSAQDESITSDPTTIVNLAVNYDWLRFTFGLELLNALQAKDADITYFFLSRNFPGKQPA
ncbi:MAG: hypothetical protein AAFY43_11060 [Pseudomonadota bacterium]